jgi:AcrR family transcriptional regulator
MTVGRPREFHADAVLETAMELFWEHGFEGVSISDLTDATGINRRSLYAAFGTKEELFRCAVRRYLTARRSSPRHCSSRGPGSRGNHAARGRRLLHRPPGRAAVWSYTARWPLVGTPTVRVDLARQRDAGVKALARRFDEAQAAGELPGVDTLVLSRWINSVCQGFSVQARSGATRDELHQAADQALRGWPSS